MIPYHGTIFLFKTNLSYSDLEESSGSVYKLSIQGLVSGDHGASKCGEQGANAA